MSFGSAFKQNGNRPQNRSYMRNTINNLLSIKINQLILIFPVLVFLVLQNSHAQSLVDISGTVFDSTSADPILGANIFIMSLAKGTATNEDGSFVIKDVPTGTYKIRFSYIGYNTKFVEVTISGDVSNVLNIVLERNILVGEEITVLAQAAGQLAAIKQQLNSNTIVNVVSKERLSELPDQNAAESVARLPGVSVQRDAGEASKVVVRGLSPRFNSITVNGVRLPGTEGDRSVDLSLVPSDVLDGIEVFKALTPDKDADAVGGTVNLLVRKAPKFFRGTTSLETGYNDLRSEFGQYKFSINASNRFFNNKLGILASGSIEKANRGSELFDLDPEFNQQDSTINSIENLNFTDNYQIRNKYGGSLSLDYEFNPKNEIYFSALFGKTNRDEQRYRKRYRVGNTRTEYDARDIDRYEVLYSNILNGNHQIKSIEFTWQSSYSYTLAKQDFGNYARFYEVGAYDTGYDNTSIESIIEKAQNNLNETYFLYGTNSTYRHTEGDFTASADIKYNLNLFDYMEGYLKAGFKYRDKNKISNNNELRTDFDVVSEIGRNNPDKFDLYNNTHIAISNFINPNYSVPTINNYTVLTPGLDIKALNDFYNTYSSAYEYNKNNDLRDYDAGESVMSAYVMSEINIGSKISFIPGVRYEMVNTSYKGNFGKLSGNLGQTGVISDTTGGQNYGDFFPQMHLKINIVEGIDIRLAYTQSLSRPDYDNLVPFESINDSEQEIVRGNPNLKQSKAFNYDAFLSYYNSKLGYLSVGAFYKEIDNVDYLRTTRLTEGDYSGYKLTSPVNAIGTSTVKGIEFDLQTDFYFLPKPLNGLILSTNIAFVNSETFFPIIKIGPRSPNPPFRPTIIDTVRAGKLPGQPDVTASFTLGYEISHFSARVSLAYQESILEELGSNEPIDQLSKGFSFWDFRLNQSFKKFPNVTVFVNMNNVTNQSEKQFVGSGKELTRDTRDFLYGFTASSGVRIKI